MGDNWPLPVCWKSFLVFSNQFMFLYDKIYGFCVPLYEKFQTFKADILHLFFYMYLSKCLRKCKTSKSHN